MPLLEIADPMSAGPQGIFNGAGWPG